MSFWTDIRDAATAPFRAIGGLVSDIASGKNVFESVGQAGFKTISAFQAPEDIFNKYTGLNTFFDKASPYTFGITGRLSEQSQMRMDQLSSNEPVKADAAASYFKGQAANAVIGAATYFGGPQSGLAAAAALQGVDKKKGFGSFATGIAAGAAASGAVGAATGGWEALGLSEYADYFGQAKNAADQASSLYSKFRSQLPVQQSGYPTQSTSGYEPEVEQEYFTPQKNNTLLVLSIMGVAAFFVLRRKHG
jgi:hypothetical protein